MKRSFFHPVILSFLVFWGVAQAVEIPVKDLTRDEPPKVAPAIPKAIPVHPPIDPSTLKTPVKLELALREIQLLRKAAQKAGGDLEVTIRPVGGIRAEDLIVPLAQSGEFEIKPGQSQGAIRVESRAVSVEKMTPKLPQERSNRSAYCPKSEFIPTLILK